jgi:hypothetical protein
MGEKLFNEEFGFFQIKKVWDCKEFSKCAVSGNGDHWFQATKAEVITNTGLKYQVPFIWLIFHSTNEKGKMLWQVIDGID